MTKLYNASIKILSIVFSLFLFFQLFTIALHPSLHLDEAYYVGASLKILSGDLFLTNHIFDKPIFQALWPIPGIIFGGENLIGLRLSAIISSLIAFLVFFRIFWNKKDIGTNFIFLAIFTALFSSPFVIPYLGSSMGEPFLLLCFVFFTKYYLRSFSVESKKNDQLIYIWYALALCTKQSAMMWAPMLLPLFIYKLQKNHWNFKDFLKEIFYRSKWIFLIFLIFQGLNKKKFAAILWFGELKKDKGAQSFIDHVSFWSESFYNLWQTQSIGTIITLLICSYLAYTIYKNINLFKLKGKEYFLLQWDLKDPRIDLLFFALPPLLHFLGISLANASHYERYLFILLPQIFLIFTRLVYLAKSIFLPVGLTLLFCAITIFNLYQEPIPLHPSKKKGILVQQIKDILTPHSFIHSKLKWDLYPIKYAFNHTTCISEECIKKQRLGAEFFNSQFYTNISNGELIRVVPSSGKNVNIKITEPTKNIISSFGDQIRVAGAFEVVAFNKLKDASELKDDFSYHAHTETWKLSYRSKSDSNINLEVEFSPIIAWGDSAKSSLMGTQKSLSFIIRDVKLSLKNVRINLTSLSTILWRNKVIHVYPIAYNFSPGQIPGVLRLDQNEGYSISVRDLNI